MKMAGWLSIVAGVVFGIICFNAIYDDANGAAGRISDGFAMIRAHDELGLQQASREADERKAAEQHEGIGAAVFFIAGIALIGAGSKKPA
jgi:hypothetical protein